MSSGEGLTVFEKIQILMHEYDGLRDEIGGRTRDGFNLFSICGVLFVGGLSFLYGAAGMWPALATGVFGLIAFVIATRATIYRIGRAAARLREIEATVNDLAGEPLLEWETKWGLRGAAWSSDVWRTTVTPRKSKAVTSN